MATRSKQKALDRQAKADTRPCATAKFVRISPFKVRIVLDIIRGKSVTEAIAILENTPKAASEPLIKLVNSAAANGETIKILQETICISQSATQTKAPPSSVSKQCPRAERIASTREQVISRSFLTR